MNYFDNYENEIRRATMILESMGFDVNQIEYITYHATSDRATFYYKDDTVWEVDLGDKKQRCMNNGAWSDWVYM